MNRRLGRNSLSTIPANSVGGGGDGLDYTGTRASPIERESRQQRGTELNKETRAMVKVEGAGGPSGHALGREQG